MTPTDLARIRTIFRDDREGAVHAAAALLWESEGRSGFGFLSPSQQAPYLARAARLLFGDGPAQVADGAGKRGSAGGNINQPHSGSNKHG
jgi:hypothetical protein